MCKTEMKGGEKNLQFPRGKAVCAPAHTPPHSLYREDSRQRPETDSHPATRQEERAEGEDRRGRPEGRAEETSGRGGGVCNLRSEGLEGASSTGH